MNKRKAPSGKAKVEISGCSPELFLNECVKKDINIISAGKIDDYSLKIIVSPSDMKRMSSIINKYGYSAKILDGGEGWKILARKRALLILLSLSLLLLLFYSKLFLWELNIQGNENISDGEILSALKECGVAAGTFWPDLYAEDIRSRVLAKMPELSWITVNIQGSVGEVICVERQEKPDMVFEGEPSHIVADKEAFIKDVRSLVGQSLVTRGEIVQKGDILISGAVESSYSPPSFVKSQGTIIAETNSEYLAICPENMLVREYKGKIKHTFSVIIGNNRINFYSDSSISGGGCDKIISVWNAEIPGLISLPISIIRETIMPYDVSSISRDAYKAGSSLEACLKNYLADASANGEIISEKLNIYSSDGVYEACLRVRCIEEIGVSKVISEDEKVSYTEKFYKKADE
ncbi:MAG: sporulation protein YqfD [Oscillospiraceae bacterium]|nr:sporulation protein YqfD [Oscillospiraceae bacterium]